MVVVVAVVVVVVVVIMLRWSVGGNHTNGIRNYGCGTDVVTKQ